LEWLGSFHEDAIQDIGILKNGMFKFHNYALIVVTIQFAGIILGDLVADVYAETKSERD